MTSLTATLSEILQRRAELVKQVQAIDSDIAQLRALVVELHPNVVSPPIAVVVESVKAESRDISKRTSAGRIPKPFICFDCGIEFKPNGNRQIWCDDCRSKRGTSKPKPHAVGAHQ